MWPSNLKPIATYKAKTARLPSQQASYKRFHDDSTVYVYNTVYNTSDTAKEVGTVCASAYILSQYNCKKSPQIALRFEHSSCERITTLLSSLRVWASPLQVGFSHRVAVDAESGRQCNNQRCVHYA